MPKTKVVVALSGGVDSSVAAFLLKEEGYKVIGVTMRLWCEEKGRPVNQRRPCCSITSIYDAERVCHLLNIPFYVLNLEEEFQQYVIDYFCREYQQGHTPNPCIACNQYIKFHFLLQRCLALDANYLATGHYARITFWQNRYHLLKAVDTKKDQSYFLYTLGQEELKHLLFPLGNYSKIKVRQLAREKGLPVADKPDSQDLCFIFNDYRNFLSSFLVFSPGDVVDVEGRVIGKHQGIFGYTIGQRYPAKTHSNERLYVLRLDPKLNQIIVGTEDKLYTQRLVAYKVRWVSGIMPSEPIAITAKIRYKSPEAAAILFPYSDFVEVIFDQPQRAVTPGQAVVFYQGDEVLGGGTICEPELISKS